MKFKDLKLSKDLSEAIASMGYEEATLIQEKSMPPIIAGKDVMGESATGSGKTLAFGAGVIERVHPSHGLQALILTPTRELAEQVKNSIKDLSKKKKLKIITIYGGVSINPQISDLRRADVVVATPGRFLDHVERRTVDTSKVKLLVLDEADRMLDMGFIDDVERIIKGCPKQRQTLFFSATLATEIKRLANRYMKDPVEIHATKQVDPSKLKQVFYDVSKNQKLSLMTHLLLKENSGLTIVFCNTRRNVDFATKNLKANKVDAIAIHGGLTQNRRTKTIELFNNAKVGVLVCTDVAARGLHIDNVSHVYNYDIPKDPKDYVHRIGRTARAGEAGMVVNFLSDADYDNFSRILREYPTFKIDKKNVPELQRIVVQKIERSGSFGGRSGGRGGFGSRGSRQGGSRFGGRREGGRSGGRRDNAGSRFGSGRTGGFSRDKPLSFGSGRTGATPRRSSGRSEGGFGRDRGSSSEGRGFSRDRSEGRSSGRSEGRSFSRDRSEGRSSGRSEGRGFSRDKPAREGGRFGRNERSGPRASSFSKDKAAKKEGRDKPYDKDKPRRNTGGKGGFHANQGRKKPFKHKRSKE